ncbi:MAG: hypothetical protein COB66_07080 [Coxiella sp. (in: Bacteria)]|nr:MAG: hypothetical protein COB66_07080 [Coxiella sp. (in: g-proteobacteria)]
MSICCKINIGLLSSVAGMVIGALCSEPICDTNHSQNTTANTTHPQNEATLSSGNIKCILTCMAVGAIIGAATPSLVRHIFFRSKKSETEMETTLLTRGSQKTTLN